MCFHPYPEGKTCREISVPKCSLRFFFCIAIFLSAVRAHLVKPKYLRHHQIVPLSSVVTPFHRQIVLKATEWPIQDAKEHKLTTSRYNRHDITIPMIPRSTREVFWWYVRERIPPVRRSCRNRGFFIWSQNKRWSRCPVNTAHASHAYAFPRFLSSLFSIVLT